MHFSLSLSPLLLLYMPAKRCPRNPKWSRNICDLILSRFLGLPPLHIYIFIVSWYAFGKYYEHCFRILSFLALIYKHFAFLVPPKTISTNQDLPCIRKILFCSFLPSRSFSFVRILVGSFFGFLEDNQQYMASSSSSSSRGEEVDERLHVLAVDDSLVDRKLIERLLTSSACKGTVSDIHPFLFSCILCLFNHNKKENLPFIANRRINKTKRKIDNNF